MCTSHNRPATVATMRVRDNAFPLNGKANFTDVSQGTEPDLLESSASRQLDGVLQLRPQDPLVSGIVSGFSPDHGTRLSLPSSGNQRQCSSNLWRISTASPSFQVLRREGSRWRRDRRCAAGVLSAAGGCLWRWRESACGGRRGDRRDLTSGCAQAGHNAAHGGRLTCSAAASSPSVFVPPNTSTESAERRAGPSPVATSCLRTRRSRWMAAECRRSATARAESGWSTADC